MTRDDLIQEVRDRYQQASEALNERQRRQWAAREAVQLGRGGIVTVSKALRISPNTIKKGIRELEAAHSNAQSACEQRVRRTGGGRKPKPRAANPPANSQDASFDLNDG